MATGVPTATKPSLNPLTWFSAIISLMDRYIVTELIMPFLFGVVVFSSIGVSIGVLFDLLRRATDSGLPFGIAVQIFLLKLRHLKSAHRTFP